MDFRLWNIMRSRARRRKRSISEAVGKSFKDVVQDLNSISDDEELKCYAQQYGLSSDEYEELSGIFDTIKKATASVGKAVGGAVQRIWEPVSRAVTQRTQYEVDTAGQRIAERIMPASLTPQPMPVVPEQRDTTLSTIVKIAPYAIGGILLMKVLSRRK